MGLLAFLDEAGDRSHRPQATDHFVMSAVILDETHVSLASDLLRELRGDLGRGPTDTLHWRNLKSHSHRLHAAATLGGFTPVTISSVVVCKRRLTGEVITDEDMAYMYTFRFLLERLSWFARDRDSSVAFTLAHIVRFKLSKLRQYEAALRADPSTQIAWQCIAGPGSLDQPSRVEHLQLADIAASATFKAFEPDDFGNSEPRYLTALSPRLYRRPPGKLTSYGLKMHPWTEAAKSAHPWVADLS